MRRSVLETTRRILGLPVIHQTGLLVHQLVQAAAQGHVQLLVTAADSEQWDIAGERRADQRQYRPIALGVFESSVRRGH